MIWNVAGLNGHVHESKIHRIWQREEAFDAGFKTLLAQSKLGTHKPISDRRARIRMRPHAAAGTVLPGYFWPTAIKG